jgi:nicotinamide mononucleotide transporter
VYFIITSIYGWIVWQAGNGGADELAVSHLGPWQWALWAGVVAIGIAGLGTLMRRYTRAALPYWDATIATLSLVAQYFLAAKYVESWVLWVGVDALAIGVYAVRRLYQTALLYLVLLGLAINGLVTWAGKLGG